MTLRLATLCSLLAASVALAQNTTVLPRLAILRVDDPNVDTFTFGSAQCNETITLTWSNTLLNRLDLCVQQPLKLWSTAGDCGDDPGTNDTRYEDVASITLNNGTRTANFDVKIAELPGFKTGTFADGGVNIPCGTTETTITHRVCGSVKTANQTGIGGCSEQTTTTAASLKLVYDTQPPLAPTIETNTPQDEAVKVTFSVDSDATVVLLEVKSPTDPDFRQIAEGASSNLSIRGDKLQNSVPYFVRLRARDDAGNVSLPSAEITMTPIKTIGLLGVWAANGGTNAGGCSTGAGVMPLLLLALAFRRARKQVRKDS